jgi:hypothetical protein
MKVPTQGWVQGLKAPAQVLNIASEASYSACPWANRPADCLLLPKIVDIVQRPCCVGQNPLGAPASNYGLTKFLQVHAARAGRGATRCSMLTARQLPPGSHLPRAARSRPPPPP